MLYNPPHFRETDRDLLRDHIARAAFATLVTVGADGPIVSHLPMFLEDDGSPDGRLVGHIARANPQWRESDFAKTAVAIFAGVDAYVSPSWYPGKAEHGKVVPTWNYTVVHVRGRLSIAEDPQAVRAIVERLTAIHEATLPAPWQVSDAPEEFVRAQLRGIVGVRIAIEAIEGKRKLSQNRAREDRAGVVAGLAARPDERSRDVRAAMVESDDGD
ncbi:MAG: FMN-binding negative transcriptional regulator [Alphaproteobacteria bacterium]